ncbi:MAG: hypothetical protein ACE5EU_08980, partial [Paracoccaceae bacterium]
RANNLDHVLPPNPWSHILSSCINLYWQDSKSSDARHCCRIAANMVGQAQNNGGPGGDFN